MATELTTSNNSTGDNSRSDTPDVLDKKDFDETNQKGTGIPYALSPVVIPQAEKPGVAFQGNAQENPEKEKRRIYKNVFLIGLAFLFNFNSYMGLLRLQSSLHKVDGLGVKASSVIFGCRLLSCMFLPTLIIRYIGHKWTIAVSFSAYIIYMGANGYAVWATMMPAAALVGLCAAPLWTAQAAYYTIIGGRFARLFDQKADVIVARFFGIFFMFFQLSNVTGSIISSTALKPELANPNETAEADLQYCGMNDCPWNNATNPNLVKPPASKVWTMVGIYIGIAVVAVLIIAFFLDNLKPEDLGENQTSVRQEVKANFLATFKHLRHKEQLILIPLTMYSGFEQAFYLAEFTKSFVTCTMGIWKIGLVTLPYGAVNAAVSLTGGHVSRYIGRIPIFTMGLCVDLCTQLTLRFWTPSADQEYVLYILASMWGFSDGIWQTQLNTLYGVVFSSQPEAAFSNYTMFESLGYVIAYAYSDYICTSDKLYVLTSFLLVGMVGCYVMEIMYKRGQRKAEVEEGEKNQGKEIEGVDNKALAN